MTSVSPLALYSFALYIDEVEDGRSCWQFSKRERFLRYVSGLLANANNLAAQWPEARMVIFLMSTGVRSPSHGPWADGNACLSLLCALLQPHLDAGRVTLHKLTAGDVLPPLGKMSASLNLVYGPKPGQLLRCARYLPMIIPDADATGSGAVDAQPAAGATDGTAAAPTGPAEGGQGHVSTPGRHKALLGMGQLQSPDRLACPVFARDADSILTPQAIALDKAWACDPESDVWTIHSLGRQIDQHQCRSLMGGGLASKLPLAFPSDFRSALRFHQGGSDERIMFNLLGHRVTPPAGLAMTHKPAWPVFDRMPRRPLTVSAAWNDGPLTYYLVHHCPATSPWDVSTLDASTIADKRTELLWPCTQMAMSPYTRGSSPEPQIGATEPAIQSWKDAINGITDGIDRYLTLPDTRTPGAVTAAAGKGECIDDGFIGWSTNFGPGGSKSRTLSGPTAFGLPHGQCKVRWTANTCYEGHFWFGEPTGQQRISEYDGPPDDPCEV